MSTARASGLSLIVRLRSSARRPVITLLGMCARQAELLSIADNEAVVVDSLAARSACDALAFVAGHLARRELDLDPLLAEEVGIIHLAIGLHLLLVLVLDLRVELACFLLRGLQSDDANRFAAAQVDEGRRHLAPVAKLERAFAETASGHDTNGIGRAAVDFDESDQPLAVAAARLIDVKAAASEHGHAHAEHLSSAEMPVRLLCIAQQFIQRFHTAMLRRGAIRCRWCRPLQPEPPRSPPSRNSRVRRRLPGRSPSADRAAKLPARTPALDDPPDPRPPVSSPAADGAPPAARPRHRPVSRWCSRRSRPRNRGTTPLRKPPDRSRASAAPSPYRFRDRSAAMVRAARPSVRRDRRAGNR